MENLEKYRKYYSLEEDYLLKEVKENFLKNKCLTAEEFFAIVIWKSNRRKTDVREGIRENGKTIREITSDIFLAKNPEDKLKVLTEIPSIGIPIASAILTICYPNDFTVVDYRARASLKDFDEEIKGDPTAKIYPYTAYFNYLNKCKMLAHRYKLSLRDFDRILWAKDFYGGADGLKEFADGFD